MNIKSYFCRFTMIVLGLCSSHFALSATSSDVFINEVTPLALPTKDKVGSMMSSIGNRRDVLTSLRALQTYQLQALNALKRLPPVKAAAPSIVAQKKELELRRDFYDQVIFSVDTKWNQGSLKAFFEKEFISRAQNDIDDDGNDEKADVDTLWKFYTYLSVAIRDLPEPREDLISFIQGYVDFSTITKPKPPADYVGQRAYSNGLVSQAARSVPQDELGDGVERIVHAHGLDKSTRRVVTSRPAEIELRMKVDMTPPPSAILPPAQRSE